MSDSQLRALTWESFLEVVPETTPRSQLPFLYSVHVECLSRYGNLDYVDAKALNIPSHKYVTPFAHAQAARPGYCYLLMYKDSIILQMAKYLGEYPTLRRVLDVPTKRFNLGVIPHLYVTLTASGALHIGVEGTWKLEGVLKNLVDNGMPRGGFRTLSKVPIETPVTDGMVVGVSHGSTSQPDILVLKVAHPVIKELGVGDRCFLVGHRDEVQGVLEVSGVADQGLTMRHVSSIATDFRLPTVRCGRYSFQFVDAECLRCGKVGRVDAHCAMCDNSVRLFDPAVDYEQGFHAYCEDVSRQCSQTRDYTIYDNSHEALVDTLLYFAAAKYPVYFPDRWSEASLFNIACVNYRGVFRDAFCDVLRAWSQSPGLDCALHSTILPWTDYMGVRSEKKKPANVDTLLKALVVGREDSAVPYVRVNMNSLGGFYLSSLDAVDTLRVSPLGFSNVHRYDRELVRSMIKHRCNFGPGLINDVLQTYIVSMYKTTHFVSCKFVFNLLRCYVCNQVLPAQVGELLSVGPVSSTLREKANWMWFTDNFALVTSLGHVPMYEDN